MKNKLILQTIPSEILRQKALPIEKVTPEIVDIIYDMVELMRENKGIGLAANQVGLLHRIIIVDLSEGLINNVLSSTEKLTGRTELLMINPEVIWKNEEETFTYNEGCLSVTKQYADVTRPKSVAVRYINHLSETHEIKAECLLSQCLQHEIDHLNGILFIDYLSKLKAGLLLKKLEKERKLSL
ncbi:MAG: peptide deformylase [Alphaproteobacteria bacterium]|nr:peptide deformylase [Alphaproteobacteria bacterium]MCL2505714.1 peptide deformylase [Alphaproteobacteria bacterium]